MVIMSWLTGNKDQQMWETQTCASIIVVQQNRAKNGISEMKIQIILRQYQINVSLYMSQAMRKCVLCHMRTTEAQISLRILAVWSAPLLFAAKTEWYL